MEVKRLLKEYRGIMKKMLILEEDILRYEAIAGGSTAKIDGQPHGTGITDKTAVFSVRAADIKSELEAMLAELNWKRWQVVRLVSQLTDYKQIVVIQGRYIAEQLVTWADLADSLNLTSIRQVQRIHGDALDELQRISEREEIKI